MMQETSLRSILADERRAATGFLFKMCPKRRQQNAFLLGRLCQQGFSLAIRRCQRQPGRLLKAMAQHAGGKPALVRGALICFERVGRMMENQTSGKFDKPHIVETARERRPVIPARRGMESMHSCAIRVTAEIVVDLSLDIGTGFEGLALSGRDEPGT